MKTHPSWTELTDYFYPRLSGSARSREVRAKRNWRELARQDERAVEQLGSDEIQLKQHTAELDKLLEREQSRKQSVEARLTGIIGLTSIAATIVLSGLVALAAGTLPAPPGQATWIFAFGGLYLTLQLFVALFAAVSGLSKAVYLEDTASDLFAAPNSAAAVRLRTQISRKLSKVRDYRRNADAKIDHMAVSHRAVKNFLVALLLLAFAAAWVAVTREAKSGTGIGERGSISSAPSALELPRSAASAVVGGSAPSEPVASGILLPLLMTAGGLALLVTGAVLIGAGKPVKNIALGTMLVAGGTTLSMLGGSKFELQLGKFDKLIGELQIRLFERAPSPPQARVVLVRVATIGPFPEADHVMDDERVVSCLRTMLAPDFTSNVGGWQVVGRVDKRRLRPDRAAHYGSNQALAMSRAVWVRDQVLAQIPGFNAEGSVVSVGGAGRVGAKVGVAEMESDRAVDVYVLVAKAVDAKGKVAEKPMTAVVCPGG